MYSFCLPRLKLQSNLVFFRWQSCKFSPQHWYLEWMFGRSKLQPARASRSVRLVTVFDTVCGNNTNNLTQYLSDHIESVQKRALRIIFPHLCYVEALRKSGLLSLRQRREDACITFLQRSYSSSHLLRSLVPRVAHTRPYALRSGESVSVPVSSKTNRFGKFCTIKYQNHV